MHTKGTWEAKHIDATHFVIVAEDGSAVAKTQIPIGSDAAIIKANAKLIAAAPDLLALCFEMRDWLRPELVKEPDRTFFWKAHAAIEKATR